MDDESTRVDQEERIKQLEVEIENSNLLKKESEARAVESIKMGIRKGWVKKEQEAEKALEALKVNCEKEVKKIVVFHVCWLVVVCWRG